MRPIEVRIGVIPCHPFLEAVARLAFGLDSVTLRSSRIEVPLTDISRAIARIPKRLPEAVLGSRQGMRVVDDASLVWPAATHQNASIRRTNRVVGDTLREGCPLGREGFQRGRLGIIEGLVRHRTRPMLVTEHEEDVGPSCDLSTRGRCSCCGQDAQDMSSSRVPRYHDLGILATLGRPSGQELELVAASAQ